MQDPVDSFYSLHRPRLLVRAARIGLAGYRPGRDLARILRAPAPERPRVLLRCLLEAEAEMEDLRCEDDGNYSAGRHVDLLIALMAEVRRYLSAAGRPA